MRWLFAVVAGMLIGISAIATSPANAQPVPPPPPPTQPGSSSTEEPADMVLDAIEQDVAASTTPAPQT
ncbi:hypothetical protein [Mycolicibacterium gadium]|uniref:Uncharacterized protein n=1 Tax=Mycolicibacterium gadium TaxID=1794 RepID=A0A7I7WMN0_MYCGU|nr:hypothetical protein [Mycolicibacterium gadium]BBZ18926.1 hypothetical protein MGAD_32610 [Mycolicibacterium gadium]